VEEYAQSHLSLGVFLIAIYDFDANIHVKIVHGNIGITPTISETLENLEKISQVTQYLNFAFVATHYPEQTSRYLLVF
jgi:hypothetical protein